MPWCEECARFWNPSSMGEGGECPTCGRVIATPPAATRTGPAAGAGQGKGQADPFEADEAPRAPWHFKLLVGAMAVYLAFRAYQGIAWLVAHA